jgi:protein-disulfide isomerase
MPKNPPTPPAPGTRSLAALVAAGIVGALWSLFQWSELLLVRAGGTSFCSMGGAVDCAAVWDTGFASAIQSFTGLPVAAWGMVWSLAALTLPLWALVRRGEGKPLGGLVSAIRLTAAAGVVSVLVLAAVSFSAGAVCLACVGTYVLVGIYAAVALGVWRGIGWPEPKGGLLQAASVVAVAFLLLLYPGLRTPSAADATGQTALARATAGTPSKAPGPVAKAGGHDHQGHDHAGHDHGHEGHAHQAAGQGRSPFAQGQGTGNAELDASLEELIRDLDRPLRQSLSDSLAIFHGSPRVPIRQPRAVMGSPAPVHITEFSDIQCGHCAQLHATMGQLKQALPDGWFSVDARNFPLDGACNPNVGRRTDEAISCHAARARICFEGHENAFEYSGRLFALGRALTADRIVDLAEPFMAKDALRQCMASPETAAKLEADIDYAMAHDAHGTPLVLVNGRQGTSFGPFLYAMILTAGAGTHPAFAPLPPPNRQAHIH